MVDIDVQCYRNSDKLGSYSDDITSDDELDIHNITWSWEISDEDLKSQTLYKCEAGLSIGERIFRRVGILAIPKEGTVHLNHLVLLLSYFFYFIVVFIICIKSLQFYSY